MRVLILPRYALWHMLGYHKFAGEYRTVNVFNLGLIRFAWDS